MSKNKCIENCRICKHLVDDTIDGYPGQDGISYSYCELGKQITFMNTHMNTSEEKVFSVFRELNTLIGCELPKDKIPQALCKQAGLSVIENKKVCLWLQSKGYIKKTGKAAGTKYVMTSKVNVDTHEAVNAALSFKELKKQPVVQIPKDSIKPKQYYLGQKVFLISENEITKATIIKMALKEESQFENIVNSSIDYYVVDENGQHKQLNVVDMSDSVDGLLSLLKYKFAKRETKG